LEFGYVAAIDFNGRTIWIADAHRDDGKRFVAHAEEKLTAFVELELAIGAAIKQELHSFSQNAHSLTSAIYAYIRRMTYTGQKQFLNDEKSWKAKPKTQNENKN
jgi:hypothetical protein